MSVSNSRPQKRTNKVWRRRKCTACTSVITTIETIDYDKTVVLKHPGGAIEPFRQAALFISIYESCKHRRGAVSDAEALTDTVVEQLLPLIHEASLTRSQVITTVTSVLQKFDVAAAVHYRAYHPLK